MHWQYHNTIKNRLQAIYVKRLYHFFSVVAVFFAVDVIFCSDKRRDDNCQPLQKITFEFPVGKYSRLSLGLLMARVSYVAVFKISNRYACCSLFFCRWQSVSIFHRPLIPIRFGQGIFHHCLFLSLHHSYKSFTICTTNSLNEVTHIARHPPTESERKKTKEKKAETSISEK